MSEKEFLLSIESKKIKYGLSRTKALLRACGNPEKKLQSIQIIGTNGKGSTAAMLANVLINNNYNIGLFTSPHLVEINERIRVNHQHISDVFIEEFLSKYKKSILSIEPSFFEIITVLSLYYFVHRDVNVAILETGLGGALDSVTAAKSNMIIFTPIDYDHMSILGNSLKEITIEKGGAIKNKNQILISSKQHPEVQATLNQVALNKKNTIIYSNKNTINFPLLSAKHQCDNANLVAFAMDYIQHTYKLHCQNITDYIQHTYWPGRIQKIQQSPDIIFDVAHNSHSLRAFIDYLNNHRQLYKKTFLIIGFEDGKDIKDELPALYSYFDYIDCTETQIRHSMPAKFLLNLYNPQNTKITINCNPVQAIRNRSHNLTKQDLLVILGSHYFGPHINTIYKNCFDIEYK